MTQTLNMLYGGLYVQLTNLQEGPFFWSTDHPIGLPKGAGLSLDANGTANGNVVYVYYSIK